ncbi:DUF1254 domain-containing protein [Paraburkholderia ginsengisoli]|uniref:DUF1254 domain-containing protein n=1 Tax=Paraburkholderia ginsengisoli TaxID=311231 RepID=A0A7T4N7P0_9BURK|nr:DUF1254 domain-containing protein [Paraburkholderia ginsengisoli]QQC66712.1 DUF1254 domain-containing protein [Paraburkholderia ginsengisoli]
MIKNRRELFSIHWTCASLAGLAFLAGCASTPSATPKNTGWIKDEVADSYVFGYPLVLMGVARDAAVGTGPGQAPFNTLRHAQALPPIGAANPPQPSIDTLDSTGWLDVGSEPVIVSLPDSHGRYIDARVLDMWTNVVWSTGSQFATNAKGIKAQTIAFVGPGWQGELPQGAKRVDVPTRNAWMSVRIQSNGARDLTAVRKLQRAIRVAPLSVYVGDSRSASIVPPRSSAADAALGAAGTPAAQVAALDASGFFNRLADALPDNPPTPADPHALKILADLGVTPGEPVKLPGAREAIAAGLADGHERIGTAPSNLLTGNGWSWFGDDVGNYGPDYALRAYAANVQPGIGTKDDEVRAVVTRDSDGQPLNGANRYVIHFASNQLPPVHGFWSITAYTKDGALGESAPARLAVGDRSGAHRNRDGSLDVVVSSTRAKNGNWLPAPRADLQLVLRLYAPKPQATDGSWQPPAVVRQ